MTGEELLGLEEAMDEFMLSTNFFNDIDIGEIDFASKALELLENSDSDSGISVTGEKQSPCLQTNVHCTPADCVLTDIVGPATNHVTNILDTDKKSVAQHGKGYLEGKTVKIQCSSHTIPKFKRIIIKSVGGKRLLDESSMGASSSVCCSLPVAGVAQSSRKSALPLKIVPSINDSSIQSPTMSSGSSEDSLVKSSTDYCSFDELFSKGSEVYEYCGDSTPSDSSLRHHLENLSSTSYSDHGFRSNSLFSPTSFLDIHDFPGPNECIISHTNLERIRKKQERMMKNRQAACLSRLRKKEYVERLEMKFEQLKRENLSLWRQNEEWRLRCSRLERCIENLQSRLPYPEKSDVKCESFDTSSNETSYISSQFDKQITQAGCSKTVSVHTLTPQNEITVGFEPNTPSICRPPSVSDLGKSKSISIQHLKNFQNQTAFAKATPLTSVNSPRILKWDSSSKNILLLSKIDVESHSQSLSHQPQLLKSAVKTLVTPKRIGLTVNHRSKVIATTSFLVMFGLFAINLVPLSDLTSRFISFGGMYSDVSLFSPGKSVSSYPTSWSGRRLLLDIQPSQENFLASDKLLQNTSDDEFLFPKRFPVDRSNNNCGLNNNMNCSENALPTNVRQILQGWITMHSVSTSNQSSVYRLLLTPSIHKLRAFKRPENAISTPKPLQQNTLNAQKSASLPAKPLNNSFPKSISSFRKESSKHLSSRKSTRHTVNVTTPQSFRSELPSSHYNSIVEKYDLQDDVEDPNPYVHPAVHAFEKLFNVVTRRNDTAYIVFLNRDHFLLPPIDPSPSNMRQKITFLLPAHPVVNGSSVDNDDRSASNFTMLQLDCEVMNATFLQS
ncbi:Cyclic AMP dependent transcription factor ATF 6 [Schistosoma japonicum]|nr:Cyclic AMP dependent transcription factor ATF 6 [Schistosoma japonicum]